MLVNYQFKNQIRLLILSTMAISIFAGCGSVTPQVPAQAVAKKEETRKGLEVDKEITKKPVLVDQKKSRINSKNIIIASAPKGQPSVIEPSIIKVIDVPKANPYSNYLRVKTIYELATETNPSLFMPHDEFETADEYKNRVSDQVKLMKEIVLITSQKMDIKKNQRIQVAQEKQQKIKNMIENIMSESSSTVEFTPNAIGRYNPEKETFPVILHQTQYQISVPREEARTFKQNYRSIKIKGLKQLKPKYDIEITASKAHIRSRPNGSIVGIASNGDVFDHVQDEDEWHKINYKGQFGFTHQNNAKIKLVDIEDEYEYQDLVAIHPTTGSMFAMISVDKLVKAPLNLASRRLLESGETDGPE